MVFLKAQIAGRMNDPEFLIKCLIEYIESDIRKEYATSSKTDQAELDRYLKEVKKNKKIIAQRKKNNKPYKSFELKVRESMAKIKQYKKEEETRQDSNYKEQFRQSRKEMDSRLSDFSRDKNTKSIDITGEEVFLTLNNKTALRELKTILNKPETKKYLSRLKQVAVKFPYDGLPIKGGKVDKNSTEYKKKLTDFLKTSGRNTRQKGGAGAKGMGATREVNTYLLEALNKLKDDSKDVKVKRNATNIIRLINNRNEEMMEQTKEAERARNKLYGSTDDSSKVNRVTKAFWSKLQKEFKDNVSLIRLPLKGNEEHNAKVLSGLLSYGGDFIVAILSLVGEKRKVGGVTPKTLGIPESMVLMEKPTKEKQPRGTTPTRTTPEWMRFRNEKDTKVQVLDRGSTLDPKYVKPNYASIKDIKDKKREEEAREEEKSELKKASEYIRTLRMIDISKGKGDYKIIIRNQPYSSQSEGYSEILSSANSISRTFRLKKFKDVDLLDVIKQFAERGDGITPRAKLKSDKKEIQSYMANRRKEIMQGLKLKKRVKKIPKVLLKEYDELIEEIVEDLEKYYAFTMDTKPSKRLNLNNMFQTVIGKNVDFTVFGKSHGKLLQEAIDSAWAADEKRMIAITEEELKEYSENKEMLSETNKLLDKIVGGFGKNKEYVTEFERISEFIYEMNIMKKKYQSAKQKIKQVIPESFEPYKGDKTVPISLRPPQKRKDFMGGRKTDRSGRVISNEPIRPYGGLIKRVKKALLAKRDLENAVIELLQKFKEEEMLSKYNIRTEKNKDYNEFIKEIDLDFESLGEEFIGRMREFEFDVLFDAFDDNKVIAVEDLYADIKALETKGRRLYAKSKQIEEFLKTATQEREEVSLLQQFFEIKRAKMTGEKIKEKPKMLDVLTQSFRANPIFDDEGKKISSIADIAKYLEKKYEKVIDLDDDDLEDFITSWKEHSKEEGKRLKDLNEKIKG
jgi:hypothetical protein